MSGDGVPTRFNSGVRETVGPVPTRGLGCPTSPTSTVTEVTSPGPLPRTES